MSTVPAVPTPSNPSVPLRQRLQDALPVALKARDRAAVAALRSALAAIANAEAVNRPAASDRGQAIEQTSVGVGVAEVERRVLTADQVEQIVRAEVAERLAAALDYERAGRMDRADEVRREAAVLSAHLGDA